MRKPGVVFTRESLLQSVWAGTSTAVRAPLTCTCRRFAKNWASMPAPSRPCAAWATAWPSLLPVMVPKVTTPRPPHRRSNPWSSPPRETSLSHRVFVTIFVCAMAVIVAFTVLGAFFVQNTLADATSANLAQETELIAAALDERQEPIPFLRSLDREDLRITLINKDGSVPTTTRRVAFHTAQPWRSPRGHRGLREWFGFRGARRLYARRDYAVSRRRP